VAHLKLAAGRQIHYECSSSETEGKTALLFHHGQPGAALLWDPMVEEAAGYGWPVVMISRAGYASSDRLAGRQVGDVAGDAEAVLDHLGIDEFVTAGWSGGGPHTLACGALLARRCLAVATLAGVAPYGVEGLDWTAGMGPENVAEFSALIAGDPDVDARIIEVSDVLRTIQADGLVEMLGGLISEPDTAVIEGALAEFLANWFRLSVSEGPFGYIDDGKAFIGDWGFDVEEMPMPVRVWFGDEDLMVPSSHGEWLAAHVRGARREFRAGEGHISLLPHHIGEIVAGLAADAQRR
jgi:pimeloyl-ACP methyl ester carboxylesterase